MKLAWLPEWGISLFEQAANSPEWVRLAARLAGAWVKTGPTERGSLRTLQEIRLRRTIHHVSRHSPFYRQQFQHLGVRAQEIRTLADLARLPFTTPSDLQRWQDFLCVPLEKMAAVFTTSGTTGEPKRVYFTPRDMAVITNLGAVVFRLSFPGRLVVLLALPSGGGIWIGPGTAQRIIERAGGLALPFGAGDPHALLQWMRRFEPNIIISSPSYMTTLTRAAEKEGLRCPLEQIMVGGEPLYAEQRAYIQQYWGAAVLVSYGATEIGGAQTNSFTGTSGLALNDFHLITEIVDPLTGQAADEGELVFTTIRREGMPLLRYRIGDRARWVRDEHGLPVSSIELLRRSDDFMILSDMGLYAGAITSALHSLPGFGGKVCFTLDQVNLTDRLRVQLEGTPDPRQVRQLLYQLYPEMPANTASGNLLLEIDCEVDLSQQLKVYRIVDLRQP